MTQTDDVSARGAAPGIDDPLAATDPNPAYLAALKDALDLANECRVPELARAVVNPKRSDLVSALLCHELAACHRLMMRFGAMADHFLCHTSATIDPDRRQVGRVAIGSPPSPPASWPATSRAPSPCPRCTVRSSRRSSSTSPSTGAPVTTTRDRNPAPAAAATRAHPRPPTVPRAVPWAIPRAVQAASRRPPPAASALRRGRLKNGNPSGDYLAAPRCGAKTRAGCHCRQPGMTNGRCRLHGGKSTGARTAEGRRRAETARLVHGRRTAAVLELRSAAAAVSRRLAWMTALARNFLAGHGVDRSDSLPPPQSRPALPKVNHRGHRAHRGIISQAARAARNQPASVRSVVNISPAGHGVDRSDSFPPPDRHVG